MTRQMTFDRQKAYDTHDRIREIVDHASRVLRKFPYETVPEDRKIGLIARRGIPF